jgi:galactoside 2-L-fucosyltransferase 1/2
MWAVNQQAERSLPNLLLSKQKELLFSSSSGVVKPTIAFPNFTNSATNWLVAEVTRGRLGNNMFQYGSAYGVFRSSTNNISFCVADRKRPKFRDLNRFYRGPFAPVCSNKSIGNNYTLELNETGYGTYTNFTIPSTNSITVIREYLISFRYFHHVQPEIKQMFELKGRSKKRQRDDVLKSMSKRRTNGTKEVVLVGIHVRRTDIARDRSYRNPPTSYYQRAMEYFRFKYNTGTHIVKFIIASDDKAWCARQPMFMQDNTILIIPDTYDPVTEMAVLSHCHHVILSIGTFGWWAAYLAGGNVIYWNNVFDMNHEKHKGLLNLSDYYPANWIGLD